MSPDNLFLICNYAVMPAWLLLAVLPHHRITQMLVHAVWIPCLLGPVYIYVLLFGPPPAEGAGFGSLQAVMLLFQSPMALLGGWVHYLVFDLFIGAWMVRDAKLQGINHWLTLPCLFATLMAGPAGLLLYCVLRLVMKQNYSFYRTV
jgi:hypothetical protein